MRPIPSPLLPVECLGFPISGRDEGSARASADSCAGGCQPCIVRIVQWVAPAWLVGLLLLFAGCGRAPPKGAPTTLDDALAVQYGGESLGNLLARAGDSSRAQASALVAFRGALGRDGARWLGRAVAAGRARSRNLGVSMLLFDIDAARAARATLAGWLEDGRTDAIRARHVARLLLEIDAAYAPALEFLREHVHGNREDFFGVVHEINWWPPLAQLLVDELLLAMDSDGQLISIEILEILGGLPDLTPQQKSRLAAIRGHQPKMQDIDGSG